MTAGTLITHKKCRNLPLWKSPFDACSFVPRGHYWHFHMIVQHAGPGEAGISQSHSQPTLSLEQNRINNLHFNPSWTRAVAANRLHTLTVCVVGFSDMHDWWGWCWCTYLQFVCLCFCLKMCTHEETAQPDGLWIRGAHRRPLSSLLYNVISVS